LAYDLVKQNEYNKNAEDFISTEAVFQNDFLLEKIIDSKIKLYDLLLEEKKLIRYPLIISKTNYQITIYEIPH